MGSEGGREEGSQGALARGKARRRRKILLYQKLFVVVSKGGKPAAGENFGDFRCSKCGFLRAKPQKFGSFWGPERVNDPPLFSSGFGRKGGSFTLKDRLQSAANGSRRRKKYNEIKLCQPEYSSGNQSSPKL